MMPDATLATVEEVVEWGVVPLILLLIFVYGFFILPSDAEGQSLKIPANAARWAGLLAFVLFVLSRRGAGDGLVREYASSGIPWLVTICCFIFGLGFSWLVSTFRELYVWSAAILILVACTPMAVYSYFFIQDLRNWLLSATIALPLGALVHRAFSSASYGKIRDENGEIRTGEDDAA